MHLHPRAEKKIRRNLQGKFVNAPTDRARVNFGAFFCCAEEIWRVGVVHLVVLACVFMATTKKGQLFGRKKCTSRQNPGYAYAYKSVAVGDKDELGRF